MAENTMESGKITTCMVRVSTLGKMVECIRASTKTIANTDMEPTHGMTVNNMLDGGKMENSMEKVPTERMDVTAKESGKTERESDGSMIQNGKIITANPKISMMI